MLISVLLLFCLIEYVLAYSLLGGDMAKPAPAEPNKRTSLSLPPSIVEEARAIAIHQHTNISRVIAEFLRQYVKEHARDRK